MKIRKPFESSKHPGSCIGCAEAIVHTLEKTLRGKRLVSVGKRNIQDEINSYKDSCDIYKLLSAYLAEYNTLPDVQITNEVTDYTALPTSVFEVKNIVNSTKDFYDQLPDSVKAVYTYNKFMTAITTESGCNDISNLIKPKEVNTNVES